MLDVKGIGASTIRLLWSHLRIGSIPEAEESAEDGHLFTADITEVVVTGLDETATMLVIESWTPQAGLRRVERG